MIGRTLFTKLNTNIVRGFHSSKPRSSVSFLDADTNKTVFKLYHYSGYALAILTPVAIITSPSPLTLPFDLSLGLIIPFHSHVSLDNIIKDYMPKSLIPASRKALLGLTFCTIIGLLKLNLLDEGLTESVKCLWTPKKEKKE